MYFIDTLKSFEKTMVYESLTIVCLLRQKKELLNGRDMSSFTKGVRKTN